MTLTTLIVEDDGGLRSSLQTSLERRGHHVLTAATVAAGRELLGAHKIDALLLDVRLGDGSGLALLPIAKELDGETVVLVMTAFADVRVAVQAMREGAHDFVSKPFDLQELHLSIERALEARELRRAVHRLERERLVYRDESVMLGASAPMTRMREQIARVAMSDTAVLVLGETGTGKELVVDALHAESERRDQPLVKLNCSAVSEHLMESELFGHDKGAFTDARQARAGLFELADRGTLFLDEVSEMRPEVQAKLLRVVEGQPFRRVGGGKREIRTDVRVVAATHRDVRARVEAGLFREDLYYRLNGFQIDVPPLRTRGTDVGLLARAFIERAARKLRKRPPTLSSAAESALMAWHWPGNVRELRNAIERAVILCDGDLIDTENLAAEIQSAHFVREQGELSRPSSMPTLEEVSCRYVARVVQAVDGNLSEAARVLGVARNTVKAKIAKSGSDEPPDS